MNACECSGNFRNVLESLEMFSNVLERSGTGNTQCYILEVSVSESIKGEVRRAYVSLNLTADKKRRKQKIRSQKSK